MYDHLINVIGIYTSIYKRPKSIRVPALGWDDLNIHNLTNAFAVSKFWGLPLPQGLLVSCTSMKMQTPIFSKQLYFAHIVCSVLCL